VRETGSIAKFKQRFCLEGSVLFSVCLDPLIYSFDNEGLAGKEG